MFYPEETMSLGFSLRHETQPKFLAHVLPNDVSLCRVRRGALRYPPLGRFTLVGRSVGSKSAKHSIKENDETYPPNYPPHVRTHMALERVEVLRRESLGIVP